VDYGYDTRRRLTSIAEKWGRFPYWAKPKALPQKAQIARESVGI
jgi:hypothetical protein